MKEASAIDAYNSLAPAWAEHQRSGRNKGHSYIEKPAMFDLLGDVRGRAILCAGCGSGEECDQIARGGANRVLGTDAAQRLIDIAAASYPEVEFVCADMSSLPIEDASFDILFSSLAIHYCSNWRDLLSEWHRVLRPEGIVVCSMEHPTYFGAQQRITEETKERRLGYAENIRTGHQELWGDVLHARSIEEQLEVGGQRISMRTRFRSFSTIVNELLASPFTLCELREPQAIEPTKAVDALFYRQATRFPRFLLFKLKK